jgi:hypothetical protein
LLVVELVVLCELDVVVVSAPAAPPWAAPAPAVPLGEPLALLTSEQLVAPSHRLGNSTVTKIQGR